MVSRYKSFENIKNEQSNETEYEINQSKQIINTCQTQIYTQTDKQTQEQLYTSTQTQTQTSPNKTREENNVFSKKHQTKLIKDHTQSQNQQFQNQQFQNAIISNIQNIHTEDFPTKYCQEQEEKMKKYYLVQDQQKLSNKEDEALMKDLQNIIEKNWIKNQISEVEFKLFLIDIYKKKYRDINLIQIGGQGFIFEGRQIDKNQKEAIKLCRFDSCEEINKQQKEREIINSIICHKYIVKTFDQFTIKDSLMIVQIMEFCDCDLYQIIQNNKDKFTLQQIVNIFYQLINSLIEIHTNNIIHFDIKPQNIIKTSNNEYKLTDFGISIILSLNETDCKKINGITKLYSSPEQYNQYKTVNTKSLTYFSDTFSMGLTFLSVLGVNIEELVQLDNIQKHVNIAQAIREGYWLEQIQKAVKKEYLTLLSFVRYYMLDKDPSKRMRAIKLKEILMRYYNGKNMELNEERDRIQSLLIQLKLKKFKYAKYIVYLNFIIQQIQNNPEYNNKNPSIKTKEIKGFCKQFIQFFDDQVIINLNNKIINQEEYILQEFLFKTIKQNTLNPQQLMITPPNFRVNFRCNKKIHSTDANFLACQLMRSQSNKILQQNESILQECQLLKEGFSDRIQGLKNHYQQKYIKCSQYEAYLHCQMGQIEQPEENFYKAFDMAQRIKGFLKQDLFYFLNQYGIALLNIQKYEKAKSIQLKCFQQRIQEEQDVDESKSSLSLLYEIMGDFNQALNCELETLIIRKEKYPQNHPKYVESLNRIGQIYILLDNFEKGLYYQHKSLKLQGQLFKGDHPDIAESYKSVALSYYKIGDYQKSIENCQLALQMYNSIYGYDNQYTADVLYNLGIIFGKIDQHKNSIDHFQECLKIRQSIFQGNHPLIAQSYSSMFYTISIAHEIFDDKFLNKTLQYYQKAYEIRKKIISYNHPDIAESINNIGIAYMRKKDFFQSLYFCNEALQMRRKLYPKYHLFIAHSLNNVGFCYGQLKLLKEAEDKQFESLEIRKKLFKKDHLEIAQLYRSIAVIYFINDKYKESIKFNMKCIQMRRRLNKFEDSPQNEIIFKQISDSFKYLRNNIQADLNENRARIQKEKKLMKQLKLMFNIQSDLKYLKYQQ